MKIPEIINKYRVYRPGDKGTEETIIGVGDEITLPDIAAKTTTISGAGLLGDYEAPTLSQFEAMNFEIPFRTFYGDITKYAKVGKKVEFIIRAAIQGIDTENADDTLAGIKIHVKGSASKITAGKIKQGETMDCSVTVNPFYIKIDGGEDAKNYDTLLEIDVFSEVYKVNNINMLADLESFL